ncbi:DNA helicase RecQ [Oribacterium sp. P6A1]|uniref:DNA helicase RecQ n=1 Tax=Oribacterium sp. P6A1 TaxID=1410612 RepID=UPI000A891DB7|nr:DNA helicase RecQ [Oribacterium sp. P6A1]
MNDRDIDDLQWNSLFEMAKEYEEQSDYEDYSEALTPASFPPVIKEFKTPEETLKALFGYDEFRPGQKGIIDAILKGRDVFAVMPTGAGKSVCYQIPAMLLPGITLVISPLISLMQDQVKSLNEAGIPAAFINSSLSRNNFYETLRGVRNGIYKIVYVAPERLMTDEFIELTGSVRISMITVDEAHCISQWGQDFRPSYMKIIEFVKMLEEKPIISAFTATATKNVREDIICILGLKNPYTLVLGFDRENLFFQVEKPKDKDRYILDFIAEHPGESGIIYCSTRKNVDSVFEMLFKKGISVGRYHAGMNASDRKKMQDDFVYDYTGIIVATNAFGMGIDKSNVRFVIHYNMPQSMENYYQEAGRAGRDGLESKCILLYSAQDVVINKFLLERKETTDIDPMDLENIREMDSQRLQSMERYCYTTECLRNYILKYFGEQPKEPCGDCGNCLREFETIDMTEAAKKIINCVYEAKERFGRGIIADAVLGVKTSRIKQIGADNYKSFGALSSSNKNLLMRLVEQLVLEGYLEVGAYQVLKMGDINKLKNPENKVFVKITDEDKLPTAKTKPEKRQIGISSLTSSGYKLFDKLRELRLEIAREENLPPYIIFNDKTLIEMAVKVPTNQLEMLGISGVGDNKYKKYGGRFLDIIRDYTDIYPDLLTERILHEKETKVPAARSRKKEDKQEFSLLPAEAENYNYDGYKLVSEIRDELNRICERENVKKIPATRLTEILVAEGIISSETESDGFSKIPTEKGKVLGVIVEDRVSQKGNEYHVLKYSPEIQKILVEHYVCEIDMMT